MLLEESSENMDVEPKGQAMKYGCWILLVGWLTLPVQAEVYQWRDAEGKVHFTDKKPKKATRSKDITHTLERTNVDESAEQRAALKKVFVKETVEERQLKEQKARQATAAQQRQSNWCERMKKNLEVIRGKVIFPDGKGGYESVPEAERLRRETEARKQVDKYCG